MTTQIVETIVGVDWTKAKADLSTDAFDNGRSPSALERSFANSTHVVIAWENRAVIGMARLLSDGVCNAYLVDVWTHSNHRRQGIATAMVRRLCNCVPGQHIGLQTDDGQALYASLGFKPQPEFMGLVVGTWLDNSANR